MRHLTKLTILCSAALVAACGSEPYEPISDPLDTAQVPGTRVTTEMFTLAYGSKIVWVPGTELVAFTSGCAVATIDVVLGSFTALDTNCTATDWFHKLP